MINFLIWAAGAGVTYWHVAYSDFGKNVFQHDLKVEGSKRDVIAFFCVAFAVFWPLWWLGMFPVCCLIGRKEPPAKGTRQGKEQA